MERSRRRSNVLLGCNAESGYDGAVSRPHRPDDATADASTDAASAGGAAGDVVAGIIGSIPPPAKAGARVAKREVKRALPFFRVMIAVRTAIAAMVAWLIGNQLGGELQNYAYAAPLGAFVAIGNSVFTIARAALQQSIGMIVGALLGILMLAVEWNGILEIGVIGGIAVLLHGVPRFSQGASMVPVVGVLVIIFGGIDADGYAIGYVGQFTLGMGIGVLVNALAPALYDREARKQIRDAVEDLASRVDVLVTTMQGAWPPPHDDWAGWGPELSTAVEDLARQVEAAREARRFNVRMLWNKHDLEIDQAALTALRSVVHRMEDVLEAVGSTVWEQPLGITLQRDERRLAADALAALGTHLRAWHGRLDMAAASQASEAAIDALYRRTMAADEPQSGVASVVFALRAIRERIDWAATHDAPA